MKRSADALFAPDAAPAPPQTRYRGTCRSASVLSALPADILRIVFSFFSQRHRLRVLSLVNKRWCGVALSTIASLDGLASEHALHLLPALTHLSVGPRFALDSVPTTLKSLTLFASGLDGVHCLLAQPPGTHLCPVSAYLRLTGLTALHFDLSTGIMRQCVVQLVSACAATLRSLTLRVDVCNSKHSLSFGGALNALALPSLTAVDSNLSHEDLEPLLRQHASQLRSLRLATRSLDRLLRDYPNPNPHAPSRTPPLRLLDLFASHSGIAAQMVPIDLSDPDWLARYVSAQASMDKQIMPTSAPRALAGQVMSSLMQLPPKLPPSVDTVVLQIAPGCPSLSGGPCLTLLEGLLSLPNLRCIDLRRCPETQPISLRPYLRWRTFLRLAAMHPKLERVWLPPGLFTEETYVRARRDVPDTQLRREVY